MLVGLQFRPNNPFLQIVMLYLFASPQLAFTQTLSGMNAVVRTFPILLCIAISLFGLAGSIGVATPGDSSEVAAIFPPWWSAAHAFAVAGDAGDIVGSGSLPFILIVQSQRPGLGARLRAAGAILILRPLALGGCGSSSAGKRNV